MTDLPATGADAVQTIPRMGELERDADPTGFWALRALAIAHAQDASGQTWTDYNLHDPGVTLLEAVCFALTDLTYRADFEVADHLCGPNGVIDGERQALFAPDEIFPCRATTPGDYRRWLLDQVPDIEDVRFKPPGETGVHGLHHMSLLLSERADGSPERAKAAARAAFRRQRGLGEDLEHETPCIEAKYGVLGLSAELEGARDPVDILADIYDLCSRFLTPRPQVLELEDRRREGLGLDQIFTGPATRGGFVADIAPARTPIDDPSRRKAPEEELSLIDLRSRLLGIPGVANVTALTLQFDDEAEPRGRVVTWDGNVEAPRLRAPSLPDREGKTPEHAAPVDSDHRLRGIELSRRGTDLKVKAQDVATRYADLRAGRHHDSPRPKAKSATLAPPPGRYLRPTPYHSVGSHFPPLYRLGEPADPPSQFRAYLALFDQLLANAGAQLSHVRDLFSLDQELGRSYWFDVLDDASAPGVSALYEGRAADRIGGEAFRRYDDAADRRHRVLDHLLALYGETLPQKTMRQFLDYEDSAELAEDLLHNKVAYLRQIVDLGRDRAAGFDYGEQLWASLDHTPGGQRRIALLIGFRRPQARRLTAALVHGVWEGAELFALPGALRAAVAQPIRLGTDEALTPLPWPAARRAALTEAEARDRFAGRQVSTEVLFQLGVDRQRYAWRADAAGDGGQLVLGPDTDGHWWNLCACDDIKEAGRLAAKLRHRMLVLTDECEGMHVVEHILLRPRNGAADLGRLGLHVSLVLPGWTARTHRQGFRDLVKETALINMPAHVAVDVLWLDMDDMARFEDAYGHWMELLRAYTHDRAQGEGLDEASRRVRDLIGRARRAEPRGR